ncbi:Phosphoribosyl 1,2-cyclic phosphodiesterase [compost metagenome]
MNEINSHCIDEINKMTDTLTFWGTGDAMGVPRVYCDCAVCQEARDTGINRRFRSLVAVLGEDGEFLIDCGPDWRSGMEARGKRFIENILVTHAHFDHIGGLPEWADACRWLGHKGNLYAPREVLDVITSQFPWLKNNLNLYITDTGLKLAGWSITGWKVNHGKNGYSYAYRLEKQGYSWVYCSDAIDLTQEQKNLLQGLDFLVLGTSFYKEEAPFATRSVYDVVEALQLLDEVTPKSTIFTHQSHDIDLREHITQLPSHVKFAVTNMQVSLGN